MVSKKDVLSIDKLNFKHKHAYNVIVERVFSNKHGSFFIDGHGGIGKTFLYCSLVATVHSKGFIALPLASSGVAASTLPSGRTAQSRFKLSININDNTTYNITKESSTPELLRKQNSSYGMKR